MTKQEFTKAVELATTRRVEEPTDLSIFAGFGLPGFLPVYVTLDRVAALISWQAMQFNGEWDAVALNEVAHFARKRFQIIG